MILKSEYARLNRAILTSFLTVLSINVQAQDAGAPATGAANTQPQPYNFPGWPGKAAEFRERVPLAPPGPYMSTALSDFSFDGTPFDRSRDDYRKSTFDTPEQRFSPDIPWPSQMSNHDYGYSRSSANRMDSDWRDGDGAGSLDNWPDNNWPAWPDNNLPEIGPETGEGYGSGGESSQELAPDDNWAPKWPRVSRPNDRWPDDDWENHDRRDDSWQHSRWPEPVWPDSRRAEPWPDSRNMPQEPVKNTPAP